MPKPLAVELLQMIENNANQDDILGFFEDRYMPFQEPSDARLAEQVLRYPLKVGLLGGGRTIRWQSSFEQLIECAGNRMQTQRNDAWPQ